MAVGQMSLGFFLLSRGDAPGYVERGLWPNEGVVNAGLDSMVELSMIRRQTAASAGSDLRIAQLE